MPIYEYRCEAGHLTDEYRSVDDRHAPACCSTCGGVASKIISRVGHAMPDIAGYRSMVTGEWIGSRSTHRAHLRQHGLVEVGNDPLATAPHRRKPAERPAGDILRAMEVTK